MGRVSYAADVKADAIALALAQGVTVAAKRSGIDRHTISRWLQDAAEEDSTSPGAVIVADTREAVAQRIWSVFVAGIDALAERVKDPRTRAGDLARIVDVLGERYALLAGGPTANVNVHSNDLSARLDGLSADEARQLTDALDAAIAEQSLATVRSDPLALSRADILGLIHVIESKIGQQS